MGRPKYLLTLVVTELSNVPKPQGHCYVQWRVSNTIPAIKGRTPPAHIRDYRCVWRHAEEVVLKLSTDSRGMLQDKQLELRVYAVVRHHHHHRISSPSAELPPHLRPITNAATSVADELTPTRTEKTLLGRVSVNLAEFCGGEGTTSVRYLLKDSKVNAVLSLEVGMTLIKGDQKDIIVPPLRSRGLLTVLGDTGTDAGSHRTELSGSGSREHRRTASGSQITSNEQKLHRSLKINTDPVVEKLYQKTFEHSWDTRPGEFTAEESIDDITHGGDGWAKNEQGERFIDLQLKKVNEGLALIANEGLREKDVRDEMKSWTITHLHH